MIVGVFKIFIDSENRDDNNNIFFARGATDTTVKLFCSSVTWHLATDAGLHLENLIMAFSCASSTWILLCPLA